MTSHNSRHNQTTQLPATSDEEISQYLQKLAVDYQSGSLSNNRRLLILELLAKDFLLSRGNRVQTTSDSEMLKYAFLGAYIYGLLENVQTPETDSNTISQHITNHAD